LKTLKNLIGKEDYQSICNVFAGERIIFPKDPEYLDKDDRNQRIRNDYDSGVSVPDLKEKYDLSVSQIYNIIEKAP